MLVLSRQRDETIMIGDDVEITIVDIRGDKVRLGITAPSRIAVHRKEVYESITRENRQAASIATQDLSKDLGTIGGPASGPARSGRGPRSLANLSPISLAKPPVTRVCASPPGSAAAARPSGAG